MGVDIGLEAWMAGDLLEPCLWSALVTGEGYKEYSFFRHLHSTARLESAILSKESAVVSATAFNDLSPGTISAIQ